MIFTRAGPAEILRASQKDDHFINQYQSLITDAILQIKGTRFCIAHRNVIDSLGTLIYYGITTLSGYQSLGEEYTGIIQTDSSLKSVPSLNQRLFMITLKCFGAQFLLLWLRSLEKQLLGHKDILPSAKEKTLAAIGVWKYLMPFIERLHKAYFYSRGGPYHLSKRITGINYVLTRFWLKDRESLYGFRLLSYITTMHLLGVTLHSLMNLKSLISTDEAVSAEVEASSESGKCCLCLESLKSPSTTPCGHLHCWQCIMEWLTKQQQCPICRTPIAPSRIVPLLNYC